MISRTEEKYFVPWCFTPGKRRAIDIAVNASETKLNTIAEGAQVNASFASIASPISLDRFVPQCPTLQHTIQYFIVPAPFIFPAPTKS